MGKSNKLIIQVCLCGAGTKKSQAPTVPYTPDLLYLNLGNYILVYTYLNNLLFSFKILIILCCTHIVIFSKYRRKRIVDMS